MTTKNEKMVICTTVVTKEEYENGIVTVFGFAVSHWGNLFKELQNTFEEGLLYSYLQKENLLAFEMKVPVHNIDMFLFQPTLLTKENTETFQLLLEQPQNHSYIEELLVQNHKEQYTETKEEFIRKTVTLKEVLENIA